MFEKRQMDGNDLANGPAINFCKECHNTLAPCVLNGHLAYTCTRRDCDFEMIINGKGRAENTVNTFNT